ncbi:hypothetical protein [Bacillus sp. V33-4]|nr:hypothetical protein [Bacillus sp. V33-4]
MGSVRGTISTYGLSHEIESVHEKVNEDTGMLKVAGVGNKRDIIDVS